MSRPATTSTRPSPVRESERTRDKNERLYARLSSRQKEILEEAAAIEGRTLSDFVLTHAQEAAQQTIRERFILSLSERDSRTFIDALLSPWEPGDELRSEVSEMRNLVND